MHFHFARILSQHWHTLMGNRCMSTPPPWKPFVWAHDQREENERYEKWCTLYGVRCVLRAQCCGGREHENPDRGILKISQHFFGSRDRSRGPIGFRYNFSLRCSSEWPQGDWPIAAQPTRVRYAVASHAVSASGALRRARCGRRWLRGVRQASLCHGETLTFVCTYMHGQDAVHGAAECT
jgi:hypothetical protein